MSLLSPQLEAFMAVADHQTVHSAARYLNITQTGVTQRIRGLESHLSTTLFTRSRKGMRLTPEGQALLRYCRATRDLEGEALAQISGAGEKKEVRVCITGPSSIMRTRIVPQCLSTLQQFKELIATFHILDREEWVDLLRSGFAQLAIVPPKQVARELDSKVLKPERYLLVGPAQWKKRPIQEILQQERIIDFDASDTMTFSYLKKFDLLQHVCSDRHFVNNTESVVYMFESGVGYGVLTAEFAKPYFERGSLIALNSGAAYEFGQALAWYPRPEMPSYLGALIKAIH